MQKPIYLIGYMYSGKTTLGKKLAQRLGYDFVDLDQLFEQRYHTTIPLFFANYGEPVFRQLESNLLHETATLTRTIVSTGGGTPCQPGNMEFILQHGVSVYLQLSFDAICARMACSKKIRPTLAALSLPERRQFIQEQLQLREPYYTQANHTINAFCGSVPELINTLQKTLFPE